MNKSMLTLAPGESILLTMRRHWIVFAGPTMTFTFLLAIPPLLVLIARNVLPLFSIPAVESVADFFLALYLAGLIAYLFVRWLSYYLDVWIITTERIIDIEQKTLFHREISEMPLDRIQNVTVEIPGFVATMLKFGDMRIQTAGAGEFTISSVTDFERAKDLILKHSRQQAAAPATEPPPRATP
ncbi:MAG: PH domain-containing protein [Candidatus Sungbacteria bacterium]|uniref:PH domain-containing protein n=1 Tax=Candidatus Sungiibacteriota bacterium TaxID=2750080 RepID=A0A932YWD3_9BACT|nr:PH domain-containing protein [Candidatus Sungbacteria bacterium]